jgi:2-haloacid dehalogenase
MKQLNNHYKAIVFDFGGVLIDWNPRHLYRKFFDGNDEAMEQFLVEIGFSEWNVRQDEGRSFAEAITELCGKFPQYTDLIRAYDERWEESVLGPIQPTVVILYALKQAGYLLYGLTNWSAETFQRFRPKHEFFSCFDTIIVSGEVKLLKPDPRIYTLLLDKTGRTAKECVFVDDSVANVAAAENLGFTGIKFESPQQLEGELRRLDLLR